MRDCVVSCELFLAIIHLEITSMVIFGVEEEAPNDQAAGCFGAALASGWLAEKACFFYFYFLSRKCR